MSYVLSPIANTFPESSHGTFGRFHWNVQGSFLELRKCPSFFNVPKQCSLNVPIDGSRNVIYEYSFDFAAKSSENVTTQASRNVLYACSLNIPAEGSLNVPFERSWNNCEV